MFRVVLYAAPLLSLDPLLAAMKLSPTAAATYLDCPKHYDSSTSTGPDRTAPAAPGRTSPWATPCTPRSRNGWSSPRTSAPRSARCASSPRAGSPRATVTARRSPNGSRTPPTGSRRTPRALRCVPRTSSATSAPLRALPPRTRRRDRRRRGPRRPHRPAHRRRTRLPGHRRLQGRKASAHRGRGGGLLRAGRLRLRHHPHPGPRPRLVHPRRAAPPADRHGGRRRLRRRTGLPAPGPPRRPRARDRASRGVPRAAEWVVRVVRLPGLLQARQGACRARRRVGVSPRRRSCAGPLTSSTLAV